MKALLLGATGLIGKETLAQLQADNRFDHVLVLARKDGASQGKVEWRKVDFKDDATYTRLTDDPIDAVFGCLGTTLAEAGSKDAQRFVDYEISVRVGEALRGRAPHIRFALVSAVGASAESAVFYSRTKGELERDLGKMGFGSLEIMQPSLLLGERKDARSGEKVASMVMKPLGALLVGPMKKYRAIEGKTVASALIGSVARPAKAPISVYHYAEMLNM